MDRLQGEERHRYVACCLCTACTHPGIYRGIICRHSSFIRNHSPLVFALRVLAFRYWQAFGDRKGRTEILFLFLFRFIIPLLLLSMYTFIFSSCLPLLDLPLNKLQCVDTHFSRHCWLLRFAERSEKRTAAWVVYRNKEQAITTTISYE